MESGICWLSACHRYQRLCQYDHRGIERAGVIKNGLRGNTEERVEEEIVRLDTTHFDGCTKQCGWYNPQMEVWIFGLSGNDGGDAEIRRRTQWKKSEGCHKKEVKIVLIWEEIIFQEGCIPCSLHTAYMMSKPISQ